MVQRNGAPQRVDDDLTIVAPGEMFVDFSAQCGGRFPVQVGRQIAQDRLAVFVIAQFSPSPVPQNTPTGARVATGERGAAAA